MEISLLCNNYYPVSFICCGKVLSIALLLSRLCKIKWLLSLHGIADKEATKEAVKQSIMNGEYQIIFFSPEASLVAWSGEACQPLI